jgi:F0F1-type ATP synthase assembly protein I
VVEQRPGPSTSAEVSRYVGHGLTWALSTLLFLYLGTRADAWAGTRPLFTLVGALVGAGAGFYSMYYHLVIEPGRRKAERDGAEERG